MLCFIHRWNISRAFDTGRPLTRLTERHLGRCQDCREYHRVGDWLARRLTDDAASLLKGARPGLGERVRRLISAEGQALRPSPSRPKRLLPRPVLAAAALLAVAGLSLIWLSRPRPAAMPELGPLFSLGAPGTYLQSAFQRAESPYQEELTGLKKTLEATADYLAARFETRLGENN
jgi:hypothetical protein